MDPDNLEFQGSQAVTRGGFGEVWQACLRWPRQVFSFPQPAQSGLVAVKKVNICGDTSIAKKASCCYAIILNSRILTLSQRFAREAMIWSGTHHPSILPFWGYHIDEETMTAWFICPWEKEGNVNEFLNKVGRDAIGGVLLLQLVSFYDTIASESSIPYRYLDQRHD